jgi:hypothetical protein
VIHPQLSGISPEKPPVSRPKSSFIVGSTRSRYTSVSILVLFECAYPEFPSIYYARTHVMCVLVNVYRGANASGERECWHLPIAPVIPFDALRRWCHVTRLVRVIFRLRDVRSPRRASLTRATFPYCERFFICALCGLMNS